MQADARTTTPLAVLIARATPQARARFEAACRDLAAAAEAQCAAARQEAG